MRSHRALYYPFIHFKDDRWLKLSALYWDSIARVVPKTYRTDDSAVVKALSGDYIKTLRPTLVRAECGRTFIEFLSRYKDALREDYWVGNSLRWPKVPLAERPPEAGGPSGSDERMAYVFYEKLSPTLSDAMIDSGLAIPDGYDGRWIGMHPDLARVYAAMVADALSRERALCPLTDNPAHHLAMAGCTVERLAELLLGTKLPPAPMRGRQGAELESTAAFLAFETVLWRNVDDTSPEQILEFRTKHLGARGAFHEYLGDFLEKRRWLEGVSDPRALEDALKHEYTKDLRPKLDALTAKLKHANFDAVNATLVMQVAAPALAGLALGDGLSPVVGAGTGFALGLIKVTKDLKKARAEALDGSPVAYLFHAQRDLGPRDAIQAIAHAQATFVG